MLQVVTTTIEEWDVVPDYIGNAQGDQEELQMAICEAAGLDFDGADCDGDSSGSSEVCMTTRTRTLAEE